MKKLLIFTTHCLLFSTLVAQTIPTVTNPATGRTWMDRNLGASQVATSVTDEFAYGDLYQWGRYADGHQARTSSTTSILATNNAPTIQTSFWRTLIGLPFLRRICGRGSAEPTTRVLWDSESLLRKNLKPKG